MKNGKYEYRTWRAKLVFEYKCNERFENVEGAFEIEVEFARVVDKPKKIENNGK